MEYNNVYIGERYVPILDGEWSPIKSYEPLVTVTYGNNSYTSKWPVPVGILPTNKEYWMPTGNYNAYITELRQAVEALQNEDTKINAEVNMLKSGKKNVLYIGDSFMYGPGVLTQSLNERLNVNESYNFSHGATGFIRDTDGLNFLHQLQAAAASSYIEDNDSITDIIIAGGINDAYENAAYDYAAAIAGIKTYIKANFKNAKVWLIPMLWGTGNFTLGDTRKYVAMFDGLKTSGYAIYPYAFTILMGLDSATYMADEIHPNTAGCNLIADYIASWIDGGISLPNRKKDISEAIFDTSSIGGSYLMRNGFVYGHLFLYARDHTFSAGDTIFTLPNWFQLNPATKFTTRTMVSAGSYNGEIYLENGSLKPSATLVNCDIWIDFEIPMDFMY